MSSMRFAFLLASAIICLSATAHARVWTDDTGHYTLEAELVAVSDSLAVLKREDHELVAFPLERLSEADREFLKSKEAVELANKTVQSPQTWTLRDGTELKGRLVDYAKRDVTIQRRRGRIYVNDRAFDNLPEFYRELLPRIVAHVEELPRADRRAFQEWVTGQRGRPKTFPLEGVVLEVESGDEYAVPFFLFTDEDAKFIKGGWDEWLAAMDDGFEAQDDIAFLLQSLLAARYEDQLIQREVAMLQLKLQAIEVGLTALWEVTLHPKPGHISLPLWVVVPGRDSREATDNALLQNPGFLAGPVRRVTRR